jgi:CheY-like chemotaxis protein
VVVAPDGEEGLTRIQKERFDIILLDLLLPKRDGFEILQAVKAEPATKDIPIVIVSNLFSDEDQKKVTALGVKHYFVKAFTDPRTIVSYVGKALGLTEAKQADEQTGKGEGAQ